MAFFDDDTFEELLRNFRPEDTASRNEILEMTRNQLYLIAHRMLIGFPGVRRLEDTDDILQGALVRMDRTLLQLPINSAADFFRLAALQIRRELLDLSRRYRKHIEKIQTPDLDGEGNPRIPEAIDTSTWDPTKMVQWEEFHGTVESLAEREQAVFDLIWYQDLSQTQAAQLLALSVDQVRRAWVSARMQLIEHLDGELPI